MKGNLEKEMVRLEEINKDLGRNEKRRDEARKDLEGIREEINRSRAAALAKAAFKDALETFATRSRENVQKGATAASTSPDTTKPPPIGCVATAQEQQESDWSSRPGSVRCMPLGLPDMMSAKHSNV